ncbi:MAG: type IV toxin-antitoxin system AbiEi family antitoxin domain-containing protein [Gammaproteobacteria bacterium]|nr:type IV toxin-antitoxin system AbiEi family antitoxin domain-containing protein [Gammaproteobacteria bacterium]MDE0366744.1 type IV toxin-antitoxin system AbiEi family antitoxin domain-containing protein [Gammaproteobacteria bacterium]
MNDNSPTQGLSLANELLAQGHSTFTFAEVERCLGKSKTATANLLKRMEKAGLIDRVRRGHYALRQLGVLGTPAVAEDVALSVGAAFKGLPHRIAWRSALYEHDLVVHPARTIQVAAIRRVRTKTLSGQRLKVVIEPLDKLEIGRVPTRNSYLSDVHRAVLDAADRPRLVGGAEVLAEAVATAAPHLKPHILTDYARRLGYAAALRRLGSLADTLKLHPLAGAFEPIKRITADLDLEPGSKEPVALRDKRWRVRWPRKVDELLAVVGQ